MDTQTLVSDAFAQLGVPVHILHDTHDQRIDLIVDPNDLRVRVELKRRALVTDDDAARLLLLAEGQPPGTAVLVVADRVTETARERLLESGRAGFLDLRGRLALRTRQFVVDSFVEPVLERPGRTDGLSGKAGLEVAAALLMEPGRKWPVRELARNLNRAASTVSEVLASLRGEALLTEENAVMDMRLFWRLATRWQTPRTHLHRLPQLSEARLIEPLRLGLLDVDRSEGWALTDTAAAVVYGAPVGYRSGQVLDFFVPSPVILRRAKSLLGASGLASEARATVRVAPVPAAAARRVDLMTNPTQWPLAHPVFVALDLAQDVGRGREILDAWTPAGEWQRVW